MGGGFSPPAEVVRWHELVVWALSVTHQASFASGSLYKRPDWSSLKPVLLVSVQIDKGRELVSRQWVDESVSV